ncbi:MAG: CRISPR-associated CARF protein Csx1 [Spirochaetes bacterium]|nr:CRISPR-associated CARF protein Csx1 [Spirochaetota bacterium]
MKILICIWGNYKFWGEVSYRYDDETERSNTTLPLLYKKIKPDRCFVIVGDTLVDNLVAGGWKPNSKIPEWHYELCTKIREDVNAFINEKLANINQKCPYEVMVIPAVGRFANAACEGHPRNFYMVLYYEIFRKLRNLIENEKLLDNNVEIYLDITHGINYMTTSTYSIIRELCGLLSYFCDVMFTVLNSDPVVPGKVAAEGIEVNINETEKVICSPEFNVVKYPDSKYLVPMSSLLNEEKKEIGNQLRIESFSHEVEQCYAFFSAARNGTLLFMYYFFPDVEKVVNKIKDIIEKFISLICLKNENKLIVCQKVLIAPLIKELAKILLFAILLKTKYNVEAKKEITLDEFKLLKELYESEYAIKSLIENELSKIELAVKNQSAGSLQNYSRYAILKGYEKSEKAKKDIKKRDFFAHSGFLDYRTLIKKEGDNIFIRAEEEFLNKIKNTLIKSIMKASM